MVATIARAAHHAGVPAAHDVRTKSGKTMRDIGTYYIRAGHSGTGHRVARIPLLMNWISEAKKEHR